MILEKLSAEILNALKICSQAASEQNTEIFLIGGIVRDLLLNREILDIDVCLTSDAIDFAKGLEKQKQAKIIQIQPDLRTAKIEFADKVILDLASTRQESYPRASYLPVITGFNCSLKEDVARRDFTVNSIAVSLCRDNFGEIIDLLGGIEDLKNKKLRILHDNSFSDDPSRIIRALKYATRFDFELEADTQTQMEKYLNKLSDDICYSRIISEIKLTFSQNGEKALKNFWKWNLQKLFNAQRVILKTEICDVFEQLDVKTDWFGLFASVFIGTEEENLKKLFDLLNFENAQKKVLTDYVAIKKTPVSQDKFETYNKFVNKDAVSVALYYAQTGNEDALLYKKELEQIRPETNGNDLIAIGIEPSRQIKTFLDLILKEKLNGNLKNKNEEISYIQSIIKNA